MRRLPLHTGAWTVRAVGDLSRVPLALQDRVVSGVPAQLLAEVGTCVHTDLMDAGVIPDPAIGDHEAAVEWVSWTDWCYECVFESDEKILEHHEIELVFDSLDTIARIDLNGVVVGRAHSEFIPWRFPVYGILKPGRNTLHVTFTSPLRHAYLLAKMHGRPHNGDQESADRGGPWHPYNMLRKCASNFGWDWGPRVATCGLRGPSLRAGSSSDADSEFRPAEIRPTNDFRSVFCKGVNWIPEGLWPRDRTRDKIRVRLEQAKAMGCNMIRVWGGGRYESDAFYEICDELGLMVWQDFMFACALYPEEEPFHALVEAEARFQVARLSKHPCVVVWCGGNENHWAYESWGFKERLKPGQSWGKAYWQELFPRIVRELSPHTLYVPDSPWSPPPQHPNDADSGDRHTWDLFGPDFLRHVPRFCSEFGVQSPSTLDTLCEAGLVSSSAESLIRRQRGPGGMTRWYDEMFAKAGLNPPPIATDFPNWHAAALHLQADWLYLAIVWLRANAPHCGGALVWQLNDAWPGFSWSLIDSAGREKPAYYAVKRAFADRLCETISIEGVLFDVAINDTDEPWSPPASHVGWTLAPRTTGRRPALGAPPSRNNP